jgi:hypothetical protein
MELAVFWLVIIGPTLIGLASAIWFGSGKTPALWIGFCGTVLLVLAGTLQWQQAIWKTQAAPAINVAPTEGAGGKGGTASVGGNGVAIGGPGGHAGKYGKGGDGGSAHVHGDGVAAGGAGGSASEDGIWRAPAKSGYEIYQRSQGLPVDPMLRNFGRGGASPGYEPKLKIVEQIRVNYFRSHSLPFKSTFADINAVPLDYVNQELKAQGEDWRARIVDNDYEFYVNRGLDSTPH